MCADTAFSIGVIRELEKGFLEEDEYTRFIEAKSPKVAIQSLGDTVYGRWMDQSVSGNNAFHAVATHLEHIHRWLAGIIDDDRVVYYMSARYDALNIINALLAKKSGAEAPPEFTPLGSFTVDILQSVIWQGVGWDVLPEMWEQDLRELMENIDSIELTAIPSRIEQREGMWRDQLAFTPLMRKRNDLYRQKKDADNHDRPLGKQVDATKYEIDWDERLLKILKDFRLAPVGYDAVLSFWYGKELEAKQLRLLLAGKLNGISKTDLSTFKRSLYREL